MTSPTVVRVECHTLGCGTVEVTADRISLDVQDGHTDGHYRFTCPNCATPARRPADSRLVSILLASGARPALTDGHVAAAVQEIRDASTREILEAAGR